MIIKCDSAQLEWRVKAYLAQDLVAIREIKNGEDLHTDNQKSFGLPSRLIAKIFIYRMIFADAFGPRGYDTPAYAYANDNDFCETSSSQKFWVSVITKFFDKYPEIKEHSINLIRTATTTGQIVNCSGRFYKFAPYKKNSGDWDWPRTNMLNHPVQGLAADFMTVVRLELARIYYEEWMPKWKEKILLVNTVHDDIELDVDNDPEIVYNTCTRLVDIFRSIPKGFKKRYGVDVNVPFDGEAKFGFCLAENKMVKFNSKTFEEDFKELCKSR